MNLMRCVSLVLCAVLAIGARAQNCFQPDGFNGACCAPASSSFPVFPAVTLPGKGASLRNCGVDCEWNTTTAITPIQVLCDYWLFAVSITGATPADPSFAGQVFLGKYARTWGELTPDGPIQVWRWIINSEVFYATPPAGAPTCKYPFSALPPFSLPVHFQGHVDYSFNCANGVWEVAMALTHLCTLEVHGPFSSHPLVVPPGVPPRTYQFVAPANFVFGPGPSAEGSVVGDAQRSSFLSPAGTYTCYVENPIVAGTLTTAYCDCLCADSMTSFPTYHHQTLTATVASCGVTAGISLFPLPGVLPTGLRAHMFGSWTTGPGTPNFPGSKHVGHYMGVLIQTDVCPIPPGPFGPIHAVTGVGTAGGHPMVIAPGAPPTTEAVDLTNMLVFPNLTPGMGGLFISDKVWSFNLN